MKPLDGKDWNAEYQRFLESDEAAPSSGTETAVLGQIHQSLNPSPLKVFAKMAGLHAAAGSASLLFCPQFGLGLGHHSGLMGFFMTFGDLVCRISCGATFVTLTAISALIFLRGEELRVIRRSPALQFAGLALLSTAGFVCTGAIVLEVMTLAWLSGFIVAGLAVFEGGIRLRARYYGLS